MKKVLKYLVYIFACIGFSLTAMFFAVKLGLTNTKGIIDTQRDTFIKKQTKGTPTFVMNNENLIKKNVTEASLTTTSASSPSFASTEEWKVLKSAIYRDREDIYRASAVTKIQSRLIASILIVEQLRLYNDNREIFKTIFAPLKILGNQSQFSWGVMGIKQETAIETENHLRDASSSFYLGKSFESLLEFTTDDHDRERFERLVNEHDRYYSYLYGATILKQIESQWLADGYDISKRPEILATLFNIGFSHSKPNTHPYSGGAAITVGSTTYSFGSLAKAFYDSNELIDIFPR